MNGATHNSSPRAALLRRIGWLLVVLLVAAVFGPTWLGHIRNSLNPMLCNDDARIWIAPFLENLPNGPVGEDAGAEYILATGGLFYRGFYGLASRVVDVRLLSGVVGHILFALTVAGLCVATFRWGGWASVFVVIAVCVSCDVFLERTSGGMPRSFAFPLLAWGLVALVYGRLGWLGALVVAAAQIYPSAMVPLAVAFAAIVLAFPASDRGTVGALSLRRRVSLVVVVAVISGLMVAPSFFSGRAYGRAIGPERAAEFPEVGPGGRLLTVDLAPYRSLATALVEEAPRALLGGGEKFLTLGNNGTEDLFTRYGVALLFIGMAAGGFLAMAMQSAAGRRVAVLAGAAAATYILAIVLSPHFYLPQRYVAYPIPILVAFIVAAGPAGFVVQLSRRWVASAAVLLFGSCMLVVVGGPGNPRAGLNIDTSSSALYPFLATLPRETLVAGWPEGELENVSYFSARRAFVTLETLHPFYDRHVLAMRERTDAVLRAYFAAEPSPIDDLRIRFGVTHMLVDKRHFQAAAPTYIEPFNALIAVLHAAGRAKGFLLADPPRAAVVFEQGDLMLIDVARLGGDRT